MRKALHDVIFASEKRKNLLLILQDGPKEMELILKSLDTKRQSLLPQLKILEEHHLVDHYDDSYELTTIGRLVMQETIPAIELMEFLDRDIEYWGTRNLDFIPHVLLRRIKELSNYRIVNPTVTEMHEMDREFSRAVHESESLYGVTNYFHPKFPGMFTAMEEKGLKVNFILSQGLYDKLETDSYADFHKIAKNELFRFYVYPGEFDLMSFMFHDNHLMMHILDRNKNFDNRYILCQSAEALYWAKELFEHYRQHSKLLIRDVQPVNITSPAQTN